MHTTKPSSHELRIHWVKNNSNHVGNLQGSHSVNCDTRAGCYQQWWKQEKEKCGLIGTALPQTNPSSRTEDNPDVYWFLGR